MAKTTDTTLPERLTKWLYERREAVANAYDKPLYQFASFAAFVGILVVIMTAGFDIRGRGSADFVAGEVAPFDVKATQDFTYNERNSAQTQLRREEAAANVAPQS